MNNIFEPQDRKGHKMQTPQYVWQSFIVSCHSAKPRQPRKIALVHLAVGQQHKPLFTPPVAKFRWCPTDYANDKDLAAKYHWLDPYATINDR